MILMDFGKIMKEIGKSSMEQLTQLTSLSGQLGNGGIDGLGINEIEVWIDEEGYNRRTVMKIALIENSAINFDMRMFGFNDDMADASGDGNGYAGQRYADGDGYCG